MSDIVGSPVGDDVRHIMVVDNSRNHIRDNLEVLGGVVKNKVEVSLRDDGHDVRENVEVPDDGVVRDKEVAVGDDFRYRRSSRR